MLMWNIVIIIIFHEFLWSTSKFIQYTVYYLVCLHITHVPTLLGIEDFPACMTTVM